MFPHVLSPSTKMRFAKLLFDCVTWIHWGSAFESELPQMPTQTSSADSCS